MTSLQPQCIASEHTRESQNRRVGEIHFKMGNYCTKLSWAGFHETALKKSTNKTDKNAMHTSSENPKRG